MICVASNEKECVSCAISERDACMDFAITFLMFASFTSSYAAAGAAAAACATAGAATTAAPPFLESSRMSRSIILPLGACGYRLLIIEHLVFRNAFGARGNLKIALRNAAGRCHRRCCRCCRCRRRFLLVPALPVRCRCLLLSPPQTANVPRRVRRSHTFSRHGTSSPSSARIASIVPRNLCFFFKDAFVCFHTKTGYRLG